jgi:hypothetical protein
MEMYFDSASLCIERNDNVTDLIRVSNTKNYCISSVFTALMFLLLLMRIKCWILKPGGLKWL